MKRDFFDYMSIIMKDNPNIYLIFVGLGWPRINEFINAFPDRAINTEASEATALDISVGLAYAGKIPFVYTITPFFLRGFETLRTYVAHEHLHVCLVGAGRDDDYSKHDGFSHDATDISYMLEPFIIAQHYPDTVEQMQKNIDRMIEWDGPSFISIPK